MLRLGYEIFLMGKDKRIRASDPRLLCEESLTENLLHARDRFHPIAISFSPEV